VADRLLELYKKTCLEDNDLLKFVFLVSPIALIMAFYMFVSTSTSSIISFSAFITSMVFMCIAFIMLCEILKKDVGPRGMQDIAEVIREGSEGFFVTQYGTIFKYAFLTSLGLFVMYALRDIPA